MAPSLSNAELIRQAVPLLRKFWMPHPLLRRGAKAQAEFSRFLSKHLRTSLKHGLDPWCLWNKNVLRAVVRRDRSFGQWIGLQRSETFAIGLRPNDLAAQRWVVERIREELAARPAWDLQVVLPAHKTSLEKELLKLGMVVDSTMMVGSTQQALASLTKHLEKKERSGHSRFEARQAALAEAGLRVRELETSRDVRQLLALKKKVFAEVPERCWFASRRAVVRSEREKLMKHLRLSQKLRARTERIFLVVDDKENVRGYAAVFFEKDNKAYRDSGGLDYCFAPELRGMGFGSLMYLKLLSALSDAIIEHFRGHTSNPAVLHMAAVTGRVPVHKLLVRSPPRDNAIRRAAKLRTAKRKIYKRRAR